MADPSSASERGGQASNLHMVQENLKEKQAMYKEAREARKAQLTAAHRYMFGIMADRLALKAEVVEEFVLDSPSFAPFENFFAKGGRKTISFIYQETEVPGIECGRTFHGLTKGAKITRIFLASLSEIPLKGSCLFFVRTKIDVAITPKNVHEETCFLMLDITEGLLKGTSNLLSKVFTPAIYTTENWGALNQSKHGEKDKQDFKDTMTGYITFLDGIQMNIEGMVHLDPASDIDFSRLVSFEDRKAAAADLDMVHKLESILMTWYKQIEQVLIESDQIRKEADSSGPLTEIDHWKRMLAKFSSITEHINGLCCKAVINVLNINQSKALKMWKEIDARITECTNEAKDNVKFLCTLEKVCQLLYSGDPVTMAKNIQELTSVIGMIHNVSQYYNTSERITSLFKKVTNQMVAACRNYITDNGTSRVWDQDTQDIIRKIQDCNFLFREYQSCFHKTKKQLLAMPEGKPFEMSEMYIFGKFEGFCKRLEKITQMISAVETFSVLDKSTIEGIDTLARMFHNIFLNVKKKEYDILAYRKAEFEDDFAKFMSQIHDLEKHLQKFMNSCFSKILSTQQALSLLQRFQKLSLPCLQTEISNIAGSILQRYVVELKSIRKLYDTHREDPPLARNMPPVTGKIQWARHLLRRIHEPLDYIKKKSDILSSAEGKEVVRMFKRAAAVFMEYEILHHRVWIQEVSWVQHSLQATVLVRHPETRRPFVNFDPKITEIVREAKCMMKMSLEVPEQVLHLVKTEKSLKANRLQLENLLNGFEATCEKIPAVFYNLMTSKIKNVESVLSHGFVIFNWSSLILDKFLQSVDTALSELNYLLKKVQDICEIHIDAVLQDISEMVLIELPDDKPSALKDLVSRNNSQLKDRSDVLNQKSKRIEEAVKELIDLFCSIYDPREMKKSPEEERKHISFSEVTVVTTGDHALSAETQEVEKEDEFEKECKEMYSYFSSKLLDALVKATRLSLNILKQRIFVPV